MADAIQQVNPSYRPRLNVRSKCQGENHQGRGGKTLLGGLGHHDHDEHEHILSVEPVYFKVPRL